MTGSLQVLDPDALVVALLCTEISDAPPNAVPDASNTTSHDTAKDAVSDAVRDAVPGSGVQPLSHDAYHAVAYHLYTEDRRPSDLLDLSADALSELLPEAVDAERVAALLDRRAALDAMLSDWHARGGWVLARSDAAYPGRLRHRLRHDAPPLLFGLGPVDALADADAALLFSRNAPHAALDFAPHVADAASEDGLRLVFSASTVAALPTEPPHAWPSPVVVVDALPADEAAARATLELDGDAPATLVSTAPPGHTAARETSTQLACALSRAVIVGHAGSRGVTWSAVANVLHHDRVPVVVRTPAFTSPGHRKLLARGARPIDERGLQAGAALQTWLFGASLHADAALPVASSGSDSGSSTPAGSDGDPAPNLSIVPSVPSDEHVRAFFTSRTDGAEPPALFPLVWPILQPLLDTPRSEREVRDAFSDASLGQIRDWLHHATGAGLVTRTERPVRYVRAGRDEENLSTP